MLTQEWSDKETAERQREEGGVEGRVGEATGGDKEDDDDEDDDQQQEDEQQHASDHNTEEGEDDEAGELEALTNEIDEESQIVGEVIRIKEHLLHKEDHVLAHFFTSSIAKVCNFEFV